MLKKFNITIALLIIISNFYFLYLTYVIISSNGGSFGLGLITLPFTFLANFFIIPSSIVLKKENHKNPVLLLINTIGISYLLLILMLFLH